MAGFPMPRLCTASLAVASALAISSAAPAQVAPKAFSGVPQMVIPLYPEVGAPSFTTPAGSADDGGGFAPPESGSVDGATGSAALDTMNSKQWGAQAGTNAGSIGVNPSALAATCAVESGCDSSAHNGNFTGAFQMGSAAFTDGLATALAANPALASQIVSGAGGISDPATNAISAAGYMLQGANALEKQGVVSPTYSQVRGYFQFGPADGLNVANAPPDATLSTVLRYTSDQTLARNNLTPSMTVAQYQASFAGKAGGAANQIVKL